MTVSAIVLAAALGAAAAQPAAGGRAETFVEAGPGGALKGTMLAPAAGSKAPMVVMIPGSGPTDRDGNNPMGVKAAPYRLLAEALADRGVATIRVDKRGMFASAGAGDPNAVTVPDYAQDARAWLAEAKRRTGAPCAWLLGHSEGALVALAAAQDAPDLCGLVLVSGAGRRMGDVMREQLRANPANGPILEPALKAVGELEAGRRVSVETLPPPLQALFAPQVQGFVISLFSYDPQALLRAYKGPVLVLQGTTDLQVSTADAERLAAARPGVSLTLLEGVNHVLKAAPADRGANMVTYAGPGLPLAPRVADAVAGFVLSPR